MRLNMDAVIVFATVIMFNALLWGIIGVMFFIPWWIIVLCSAATSFISVLGMSCFMINKGKL